MLAMFLMIGLNKLLSLSLYQGYWEAMMAKILSSLAALMTDELMK